MIRTLIEVTAETHWDHKRDLNAALDRLGFQPKDSADHVRYMSDLWQELADRGLEPRDLVAAQRDKKNKL